MRYRARHRVHLGFVPSGMPIDDQLRAHIARVGRVANERDAHVVLHDAMVVHFARRLRYQEVQTPKMRVIFGATLVFTLLTLLATLGGALVLGQAYHLGVVTPLLLGVALAASLSTRAFELALYYLSPWVAYVFAGGPPPRPAAELLAWARESVEQTTVGPEESDAPGDPEAGLVRGPRALRGRRERAARPLPTSRSCSRVEMNFLPRLFITIFT